MPGAKWFHGAELNFAQNLLRYRDDLEKSIKDGIKKNCSPGHVPVKVIAVDDIPYTINMKKVELAVRKIIHNEPVLNWDALANPEALDLYQGLRGVRGRSKRLS
jgi:acetoacetyl-CoA synthetase